MLMYAVIFFLILTAILLWVGEQKQLLRLYPTAKTAASLGFLGVATTSYIVQGQQNTLFFTAMLPCFLLCLVGDVLLALANAHGKFFSRFFLGGVGAFLAAHIGFCIAFTALRPAPYQFFMWEYIPPVCIVVFTALLTRNHRFQLRRMKVPVLVYSGFVGLMCVKGIHYAVLSGGTAWLVAAGSILFLLSDFIILFLYFYYKPRRAMRFLNLLFYYIGMLALALAV